VGVTEVQLYDYYAYMVTGLLHLLSDFRVEGKEHVPARGPFIVTCNHVFDLDSQYLGSALYPIHVHYMAKQELLQKPLVGDLLRRMHVYPVNRLNPGPGFIKHTLTILKQGGVVGIFPEGTRSVGGRELKAGAVRIALRARVPILPAWYEGPLTWRSMLRRPKAVIRFGPMLHVEKHSDETATDDLVQQLMADLSAATRRLSHPNEAAG
jgi:1-acyl-sn-glycerol-3-phosphate acyltransferase